MLPEMEHYIKVTLATQVFQQLSLQQLKQEVYIWTHPTVIVFMAILKL